MSKIFWTVALVSYPFVVVWLLIFLYKFGKKRNAELFKSHERASFDKLWRALKEGDYRSASQLYFFATLPDGWVPVMRALRALLGGIALLMLILLGFAIFSAEQ